MLEKIKELFCKPKEPKIGELLVKVYTEETNQEGKHEPLAGAYAKVYRAKKPNQYQEDFTDPEGIARFLLPEANDYVIEVSYPQRCFRKAEKVIVYKDKTTTKTFYLHFHYNSCGGNVTIILPDGSSRPANWGEVEITAYKDGQVVDCTCTVDGGTWVIGPGGGLAPGTYNLSAKHLCDDTVDSSKSVTIAEHQHTPQQNIDYTFNEPPMEPPGGP